MNILVYCGSFDPPHQGHLSVLNDAVRFLGGVADGRLRVHVVPAWLSVMKNSHTACYKDRFDMVKFMVEDAKTNACNQSHVDWIVDDYEGVRKEKVYTWDYIRHLQEMSGDATIWFLIGSDNLQHVHEWERFDEIQEECTFLVAMRPGTVIPPDLPSTIRFLPRLMPNISSTKIRRAIKNGCYGDKDGILMSSIAHIQHEGLYK